MRLRFFTVPVLDADEAAREVNAFLAKHRILHVECDLVADAPGACWALCIRYQEPGTEGPGKSRGRGRIDYREVLTPAEFEIFADMRRWRKERAVDDGVPPYQVFTNEQLAAIIEQRIQGTDALGRLPGVGPARIAKYGQAILEQFGARVAGLDAPQEDGDATGDDSA